MTTAQPSRTPPAALTTRQERAHATRRLLIEVAVELFAERPYNDVQVGEITKRAGVAHGLLFHYFGSKRGIYLEAVREISHRLFELPLPDPAASPYMQIRELLRAQFHRAAENEALLLGFMRGPVAMAADPEAWEVVEHQRMRIVSWSCELAGLDPAAEAPQLTLRAAADALDQLSVRWLQQGRVFDIESLVEAMVQIVIGALGAAGKLDPALNTAPGIRSLSQP